MTSRPQFSLRMLFVVTIAICLAAATIKPPPGNQTYAVKAQAMVRMALCIVFPAMLTAAAIQGRGYFRTFCIGGVFPPLAVLFIVCFGVAIDWRGWMAAESQELFNTAQRLAAFTALMWAFIPVSGLACVFFHWLFQFGDPRDKDREDRGAKPDQSRLRK